MKEILLGDILIEVERRAVRNMRLTVYRTGRVRLVIPWLTPESTARKFVEQRTHWIQQHYKAAKQRQTRPSLHYTEGEQHLLFGAALPLHIQHVSSGAQAVINTGEALVMYCRPETDEEHRQALLHKFYRSELYRYITTQLKTYTLLYREADITFRLRQMKTEWGSCMARKRTLLFNTDLAKVPCPLVDYVIVHELCHLQVQNHGPLFKQLLGQRMPDWQERKQLLNKFTR